MEVKKNYQLLFMLAIIAPGTKGDANCNLLAHDYVKLPDSYEYSFGDCVIVELHHGEHTQSNNLKVIIQSINGTIIQTLDLYESSGYLADFSTPIYLSQVQSLKTVRRMEKVANYNISKTSIANFAPELGFFTFYHDTTKLASLIHIYHSPLDFSMEGNVGDYVLRRLPSTTEDGYFQYIYVEILKNQTTQVPAGSPLVDLPPETFNLNGSNFLTRVSILVILDSKKDFKMTPEEIVKLVMMYYNWLDMLYCRFIAPIMPISIKGIVIPEFDKPNPFIGSIAPSSPYLYHQQINELLVAVYNHQEFFHLHNDFIVNFMTERPIFNSATVEPTNFQIKTLSDHRFCDKTGPSIFVSFHVNFQAGHAIFLSRFMYLFTSPNWETSAENNCRDFTNNNLQENMIVPNWPSCIIKEYSEYLRSHNCSKPDADY